jgi:coenzyme F420-dependent glucose-6-phosphate dehydrogenase
MAIELGYTLSAEEFAPNDLVRLSYMAEETGFTYAFMADHFHPWVDEQGHSPFVWSVLGGIAQVTEQMHVGTGVTCPTLRIHPAIVAQAAATTASMMPGRFYLGVGTGENLNEHVLGDVWPPPPVRLEMLEEAIDIIRELWKGGTQTHLGKYYTVDQARIYTLPDQLPPIFVAAAAPAAARLAGRLGDGLICTSPKGDLVQEFQSQGNPQRPRYGQLTVCYDEDESEAKRIALREWPNAAIPGTLNSEIKLPEHFQAIAQLLTEDAVAESVICGPDPERHLAAIHQYAEAGFDHVYVHQVGPKQEEFLQFYQREIMPNLRGVMPKAA